MSYTVAPIGCSVGKNGINRHSDTKRVQMLVNEHYLEQPAFQSELDGSVGGLLVEDGKCGDRTITAIRSFQMIVMGKSAKWSDGLVEAGGQTWRALSGNVAINAIVPTYFNDDIAGIVGDALGNCGPYVPFSQSDYGADLGFTSLYDSDGDGVKDRVSTIATHGCLLCTLTMAATAVGARTQWWPAGLKPQNLTPPKANEILKKSGAFGTNYTLNTNTACPALGMDMDQYGHGTEIPPNSLDLIRGHIAGGNPVAAHVDYKKGDSGDHWVLITKAVGGGIIEFEALDPAGGKEMYFHSISSLNDRYHYGTGGSRRGVLFGVAGTGASENQRRKQMDYIVQRFILLSMARSVQ